jgi:hypothetical protein
MQDIFGRSLTTFFTSGTSYSLRLILAIVIFVVGWIIAKIFSKIIKQLLITSDIDMRIAKLFGIESKSEKGLETKRQIAIVIEKIFYVLFVLVALLFALQMLGDEVISGILKSIFEKIGVALPDILKATIILAFAWVIASIVKFVVVSSISKLRLWERFGTLFPEGEAKSLEKATENIGSFLFYLILILAMMPVFEAIKMQSLVSPLKVMFDKAFIYIPNFLIGCLILFVGYFISRLAEKIVTGISESAGVNRYIENLPFETVLKSLDFAKMLGTLAFLIVMVPIIATAFEAMQIQVLTSVLGTFMNKFALALPNLLASFFLFLIGLIVGRFTGDLSTKILSQLGIDKLLLSIGAETLDKKSSGSENGKYALSRIGGNIIAIIVILIFFMESLEIIHFDLFASAIDKLILYVPHILIAFFLIILGFYLAKLLEDLIKRSFSEERAFEANLLGIGLRYLVIVFAFFMAFDQLKIAHNIVTSAFIILTGTIGLALALSFGLGGKEHAEKYIDHLKNELKRKKEEEKK